MVMQCTTHQKNTEGFSLVEVILASAIFALLTTALVGAYLYGEEAAMLAGNRARAVFLAEEGLEAVRNIRDALYGNLVDGTFGLATAGNQWIFSGSFDAQDIFTRQIAIASAGINRKSVTASIVWQQNPQRIGQVSAVTHFTNWIAYVIGNWASPIQAASINIANLDDGNKIQVQGNYAYIIRMTGVPNFSIINVSTPSSPVVVGSLTLSGTPTNIAVSGNFVYISNRSDTQELQIINVTNPASPSIVGTFNAPGTANARGVFALGTTAYLVRSSSADNEFVIVNAATPSAPLLVGSLNLNADSNEVFVSGNTAYVASSHDTQELQVISIVNPASPTLIGSLNLSGTTNALTVSHTGTTVFLGQGSIFFVINVSTPSVPSLLGTLGVSGTLNDIAITLGNLNTYAFIATSDAANEFKVINVTTPTSPVLLGQFNVVGTSPLFGVAYSIPLDRAFVASGSDLEEFIVIAPQ